MNNYEINKELFDKAYGKIQYVLQSANTSKYYKSLFEKAGFNPHKPFTYEEFMKIPYSDKLTYASSKIEMFTENIKGYDLEVYKSLNDIEKVQYLHKIGLMLRITSGSTGEPFELYRTERENSNDYFMFNKNRRALTNYDFKGKFVWLWPVNPVLKNRMQLQESNIKNINKYGDMYYIFEYSEETFAQLHSYIFKNKYEWITAPPSGLCKFAEYIIDKKLVSPKFKYIECHSEYLFDWQCELINEVFQCSPVSIYSSNEVQFMGATCENGCMHIFTNTCFIECIDNGFGDEIFVTSLLYDQIPIIRYKLGDKCEWIKEDASCRLSSYPSIKIKEYRANDYVAAPGGKIFEPFVITDSIFLMLRDMNLKTFKYKVVQTKINEFIYYVPSEIIIYKDKIVGYLQKYLEEIFHCAVNVQVSIYKEKNDSSKFRYFISQVNQ